MKRFLFPSILLLATVSHAQKAIVPGTYLSTSEGQSIKLRLSEDKKYEIVIFHGDYSVVKDTLRLGGTVSESASDFSVNFTSDANPSPGKVKVQFYGKNASIYSSSIYIGTQSGKGEPVFKNLAEFSSETVYNEDELNFEIDRAEFFYLVKEDYYDETTIEKYILPKNKNEIKFEYAPNYFGKMRLEGYYSEKDELVISEKSKKNPLFFLEESKISKSPKITEKPLETKKEKSWTYSGKRDMFDTYSAVDSSYVPSNFKLIVQDNLQKAMEATKKTPQKFLVISYDPKNVEGKKQFDEFIKNQQYSIGNYTSYENNASDYDRYNFYNATEKDKSWATKNRIVDVPSTIVLDADGNILSQTKGDLATNQYLFEVYYSSIFENLKQIKALKELEKSLNGKAKDGVVLKQLLALSADSQSALYPPPPPVIESVAVPDYPEVQEGVKSEEVVEEVKPVPVYDDYSMNETVYTKINIDKKKLLSAWDKIVNSHEKDAKPDMDYVKVVSSEIQNTGFYNKIYGEARLFDDTNFKAIDYLVKHYDAILALQFEKSEDTESKSYDGYYDNSIDRILPQAISSNSNVEETAISEGYQRKLISIYKKLMEKQITNSDVNASYFNILESFARSSNGEKEYLAEYESFFNKVFPGGNEVDVLNDMYSSKNDYEYGFQDWTSFKNSYSNASNQVAWFVVEKSTNPESIKKAIKWSESSLRIEKNNSYYLDTLAQLYYKNGEKQKAISTQELALKNAKNVGENTRQEMENVLEKMKNGTY